MADRVSVLKQGRLVGAIEPDELRSATPDELQERIVALMFGDEAARPPTSPSCTDEVEWPRRRRPGRRRAGARARGRHRRPGTRRDRRLRRLARGPAERDHGHRGRRRQRAARAGGGDRRASGRSPAATSASSASSIARFKVAQREKLGLRYVTDDRLHEGTVGSMSVAMNIVLKRIGRRRTGERGRIRLAAILEKARELIARFDIRTPGPETRVRRRSRAGTSRRSCSPASSPSTRRSSSTRSRRTAST